MKFSYTLLKKLAPKIKSPAKTAEDLIKHAFEVESVTGDTLDIAIPANRYSDAASHSGVARIVSAILGSQPVEPKYAIIKSKSISSKFGVRISAKDHCGRYSGLYAEVEKIKPSPKWLQDILAASGLRPINGVVDVMNYVMLEIGQPLHAFDADLISGGINVRLAKSGESIVSLDGIEYKLSNQDLVIADGRRALAIAGIKGGKAAEVNSDTKRIIVEAANFDSIGVYKTSRRLNLSTDASARFSHGLSPVLVEKGIRRAAQLLKEISGAKIGDWLDLNYAKPVRKILKFDINKFNRLAGFQLSESVCLNYLKRLGFLINGNLVEAPPERTDIEFFEDLAEEIINLYSYDKLPSSAPVIALKPSGMEDKILLKDKIRMMLVGLGLSEVYNYSFIGKTDIPTIKAAEAKNLIELENPISEDKKYLRPNLAAGLLKNVSDNRRFYDEVRIFEIGKTFRIAGVRQPAEEKLALGMALGFKKGQPFAELKGLLDALFKGIGLVDFDFVPAGEDLRIESDHQEIGFLQSAVKNMPDLALAELDLDKLTGLIEEEKSYEPLSKYPSVMRDLSFWVDKSARVGNILSEIQHGSPKLLDDADLVDWYESGDLAEKRKSLTFRLVFQSGDHTLTDEEVGKEMEKIISVLRKQFGIEVR